MRELKRFDIVGEYADEETVYEFRPDGECYDADEVDKLIAELNMRICEGDEDFEIANNQINRLLKIVRHQKYKRCRSMMMWCASRAVMLSQYGNEKDSDWFWKWKDKWKKLAEQFKEDK